MIQLQINRVLRYARYTKSITGTKGRNFTSSSYPGKRIIRVVHHQNG